MSLLCIRDLGKAYRTYKSEFHRFLRWFGFQVKPVQEHWVLRFVSFDIAPGEAVGIVGKNGAGKSSLLKIIAATSQPTEGKVIYNGRISAILELGMGFNTELTGRQNAYHGLGILGYSYAEIEAAIPEIESFAEIGSYFDEPVRTYSSGMQIRVAFAVATAFRPDLLIVDEALSVGDAYFQSKCYARINDFVNSGCSLLLVTHSMMDIVKHCDRAIYIESGQVVLDGSPKDVSNLYLDACANKVTNFEIGKEKRRQLFQVENLFHTRPGYRKEEYRWGQGGAEIIDFKIDNGSELYPSTISANTNIRFTFTVRFDASFTDVTAGFLIKTHDGVFLYGTNSKLALNGSRTLQVEEGDVYNFSFDIATSFNQGYYLLSYGIATGDLESLVPLDRRYDSVIIQVENPNRVWGIIDLQAKFDCEALR